MNRRLLLPIGAVLCIFMPMLAQGSAAAKAAKSAPATCTSFYLSGRAPTGGPSGRIFCHTFYAISYSTTLRDPVWTSYHLTRAMALGGDSIGRVNRRFAHQPGLTAAEQGDHNDYTHPPFDRGHMTPANDAVDLPSEADTFFISNVVPQTSELNEGLWRFLEASVHGLAESEGDVYIVTGPIFGPHPTLMRGRIAVPDFTFKAIYVPSRGIAIAYVATNTATPVCTIVSIADLTRRAGVDPFPSLSATLKAAVPAFTLPQGAGVPLPDCH